MSNNCLKWYYYIIEENQRQLILWVVFLLCSEGGGHIGLNQRQKLFASEYIKLGNGTQAAINAGYSERTASSQSERLLRNAEIKSFIQGEVEKMHDANIMTAKEALSILSDIARGKRDEEVLMMNPVSGEVERLTKKADNNTVIKAITEILKRYPTAKQAEKLQLEIEKLKSQIGGDEGQDEKIAGFLDIIKGAVSDGLD
nr:MAG TPA: Terminase small subunit [Caudoviricetes sp.]